MDNFIWQIALLFVMCATVCASTELKTCKGVKLDATEEEMLKVDICLEEAGVAGEELEKIPPEKLPCILKCAFKKEGLLDDNGKPHKENILEGIKGHLPEVVHGPLISQMDKCLAPANIAKINNEEKLCLSYVPVFMCIYMAMVEVCAE